ncbi:MAG: indole-3-glycerol-phosphate synthase [Deltaproteobacteria bacterium]|jgi:indole-3-glycerol phosphate synthase|nr:indole-3-glycerol-phosphate synthase [Deltaproteobacteria bacterium]
MSQELARFRAAKAQEIELLRQTPPRLDLGAMAANRLHRPETSAFLASLRRARQSRGLAIIAEYKRASPSLGDIDLELSPTAAAASYEAADAISVLTEETFFKGSLSFLETLALAGKPLLRKDFIFDPLQVSATALTKAAAILLIVRLTPEPELLTKLVEQAWLLNLEPVVEVFGPRDLALARDSGARIILVNSRDLETLRVDLDGPLKLIKNFPPQPQELWIAASGLKTAEDLARARAAGFGAVLLGSALMGAKDSKMALNALIEDFNNLN